VETLLGDPSRAKEKLGWTPTNPEVIAAVLQKG
jgi:GDP-D-mannose dehydratase